MSQGLPVLPSSDIDEASASFKVGSASTSDETKLSTQSRKPSAFGGTSISFEDGVSVSRSIQLPLPQKTAGSEMSFGSTTEADAPKKYNPVADATNLKSSGSTPSRNGAVPSPTLAPNSTEPSRPKTSSARSTFNVLPDVVDPPLSPLSHPTPPPPHDENPNPGLVETLSLVPGSSQSQSRSKPRELWLQGLQVRVRAWAARAREAVRVRARGEVLAREVARVWAARAREAVRARERGEALAQEVARAWAARAREKVRERAREEVRARGEALAQEVARAWAARAREAVRAQAEVQEETGSPSQAQSPAVLNSEAPALPLPPLPLSDTNPNAQAPADSELTTRDNRSLEPFSRSSPLCLDGQISGRSEYVVASGGFADVYTGSLDNKTVAIKVVRPFSGSGAHIEISKIFKRSWREYLAWSRLSHPNILECLGFSYNFSPQTGQPSLISPWMTNGTAIDYIKKWPNVDRVEIVSRKLRDIYILIGIQVVGIARGLKYLHNMKPTIVHGDLRAGNVLISDRGTACLSDFGLSKILNDVRGMTTSSEVAGSLRWMAPELLHGGRLSVQSDVWAYGMTVQEVYTGKRPYSEKTIDASAMLAITKGELPARPNDVSAITDDVWTSCQKCWRFLPAERSSINDILAEIENVEEGEKLSWLGV